MMTINPSRRTFTRLAASAAACVVVGSGVLAPANAQFQAGREYTVLPQQAAPIESDGKIEVAEFFHYGCGHCAELEPRLDAWAKKQAADVRVMKVPTSFRLGGIDAVTMFYTLQALGELDRLHPKIFEAIHKDRLMLGANRVRDNWLEKNGVNPAKYQEAAGSFSILGRNARVLALEKQFAVTQVPVIIVAGKYSVGNSAQALAVVDMLIAMERQANAAKAPAKPQAQPTPNTPAAKR
jgi:protein dithiol oxidoreductase (disulfide-forming)